VPGTRYAPAAAGAATALTFATFFIGKDSLIPLGFALLDRLVAVGLVWLIAGAVVWKKRRRRDGRAALGDRRVVGRRHHRHRARRDGDELERGAERLYGFAAAEIVGTQIADFQPRAAAEWEEYLGRIAHGEA